MSLVLCSLFPSGWLFICFFQSVIRSPSVLCPFRLTVLETPRHLFFLISLHGFLSSPSLWLSFDFSFYSVHQKESTTIFVHCLCPFSCRARQCLSSFNHVFLLISASCSLFLSPSPCLSFVRSFRRIPEDRGDLKLGWGQWYFEAWWFGAEIIWRL